MPKLGTEQAKSTWSSDSASDLWSSSSIGKSTGPPPGLAKNGSTPSADSMFMDSWNAASSFSTWLLLKNLTTQIDGSTLRTLCVQHGPLQHFHLYLNHGIALCKYNSREEASKAQQTLNNCVLGNTTICAESPSESEVQNILQHLGVPGSQGNGGNGNGNGNNQNANATAATTWRPPSQQGPAPARGAGSDSTWGSDWPATNSGRISKT
jgi:trinucleotide repeat-containing gene 6 protein